MARMAVGALSALVLAGSGLTAGWLPCAFRSPPEQGGPIWRLVPEAEFLSDSTPAALHLEASRGMLVDDDLTVAMFDRNLLALRYFDRKGRWIRDLSLPPSRPSDAWMLADLLRDPRDSTLVLWSAQAGKIMGISPAGEPAWQHTFRWDPPAATNRWPVSWIDTQGRLYLRKTGAATGGRSELLVFASFRDTVPATAMLVPPLATPRLITLKARTFIKDDPLPFDPSGSLVVNRRGEVFWTNGDSYLIRRQVPGKPEGTAIQRVVPPVLVTADEQVNHREIMTAANRFTIPTWSWDGPSIPDHHPAIEGMMTDQDGRLWVIVPRPSEPIPEGELNRSSMDVPGILPPLRWRSRQALDLYDEGGSFLATMEVPQNALIRSFAASGDHVWMVTVDISRPGYSLVRYRIER